MSNKSSVNASGSDMIDDSLKSMETVKMKNKFELLCLLLIKRIQMSNGLRHGDYIRYKSYCSKQVVKYRQRVLKQNVKKYHHKKIHKYVKQPVITPDAVNDIKVLEMVLLQSERAWAHFMALKDEIANLVSERETRFKNGNVDVETLRKQDRFPHIWKKRIQMYRRLKKAVVWAKKLNELCTAVGDDRTILEAEAYSSWMKGTLRMEKNKLSKALSYFESSKKVYQQLLLLCTKSNQDIYKEKVEEIEFAVRYCNYYKKVKDPSSTGTTTTDSLSEEMQSKLDRLLEKTKIGKEGDGNISITWAGSTIPIRYENIRDKYRESLMRESAILNGHESEANFLDLFSIYDTISSSIREERVRMVKKQQSLTATQKSNTAATTTNVSDNISEIDDILNFIKFMKLKYSMRRNIQLACDIGNNIFTDTSKNGNIIKTEKKTKQQSVLDVIKMMDKSIQIIKESETIQGAQLTEEVKLTTNQWIPRIKALRCWFIGRYYCERNEFAKAQKLFDQSLTYLSLAIENGDNQSEINSISLKIQASKYQNQAQAFLDSLNNSENSIRDGKSSNITYLVDHINDPYPSTDIFEFPPKMKLTPLQPIIVDIAEKELKIPQSIINRSTSSDKVNTQNNSNSSATGWLGSWFRS